ncbi:MAG: TlpA family protein disulfide reductase [Halolamina sp.]
MAADTSRRAILAALGTAATTGTAGCLDAIGGDLGVTDDTLWLPSVVTDGDLPAGTVPLVPEGRVVLLNFFATWCPHCKEEMPVLRRARTEYDAENLHMVSITSQNSDDAIRAFWDLHDATWPVVKDADLEATAKYEVDGYPTNLLFDRDGEPVTDSGRISAQSFETLSWGIDPILE